MNNWKTVKGLYEFHEISNKGHEVYSLIMTGKEVQDWCKMKNEVYGYLPGVGGDRSYCCWAVFKGY